MNDSLNAAADKALVQPLFLEIVNDKNYAVVDEIFSPDFVWPQINGAGPGCVAAWAKAFHLRLP